jgi:hypothetical protein
MLTGNHKKNRVAAVQTFLARYEDQGDDFLDWTGLDCTVTGDETWVSHHTLEYKRHSMQWRHTHSRGDDMAKRAGGRFLRRWYKKNSFSRSLSALRSMVTMLKSK